jgi:hypothetical protein
MVGQLKRDFHPAKASRAVCGVNDLKNRAAVLASLARNDVVSDTASEVVHFLGEAGIPQFVEHRECPSACIGRLLYRVPITNVAVCRKRRSTQQVSVGHAHGADNLGPVIDSAWFGPAGFDQANTLALELDRDDGMILGSGAFAVDESTYFR